MGWNAGERGVLRSNAFLSVGWGTLGLSLQVELELAQTGEQRFALDEVAFGLGLQASDFGM